MKLLEKEDIGQLTQEQAEEQLYKLTKTYDLEKPITECFQQVWADLDRIVNNLLWLEERISYVKMRDHLNSINPKMQSETDEESL
jgi:hypothetical protein